MSDSESDSKGSDDQPAKIGEYYGGSDGGGRASNLMASQNYGDD